MSVVVEPAVSGPSLRRRRELADVQPAASRPVLVWAGLGLVFTRPVSVTV